MSQPLCSNLTCHQPLPPSQLSSVGGDSGNWRRHYRPLRIQPDEIRLVRILPDKREAPIRCELLHTSLINPHSPVQMKEESGEGSALKWLALSHVWGETLAESPIFLNGDPMSIRRNLHECLVWLRYHGCIDPIWIDVLCIDQANTAERNAQVQAMSRIYGAATATIAYIVVKEGTAVDRLDMKQELAATDMFQDKKKLTHSLYEWFQGQDNPILEAIAHIFGDEYWKRQWTTQEFVLARSLVLISGSLVLPIEKVRQVQSRSIFFVGQLLNFSGDTYRPNRIAALTGGRFSRRLSLRKSKTRPDVLELLVQMRASRCSDPRDRIYGLLGLVDTQHSKHPPLPVDYSLCTSCVWHNAAVYIIQSTGRLDILAHCRYDLSSFQKVSWVPNWADIDSFVERYRHRPTDDITTPKWQLSHDSMKLSVTGYIIGVTSQSVVSQPANSTRATISQSAQDLLMVYKDIVSAIRTLTAQTTQQEACIAMLADLMAAFNENVDEQIDSIKEFLTACARDPEDAGLLEQSEGLMVYLKAFLRDSAPTRLFLVHAASTSAVLGLSAHPCHTGDLVCRVSGCEMPLTIRREATADKIVGTCALARHARGDEANEASTDLQTFVFE